MKKQLATRAAPTVCWLIFSCGMVASAQPSWVGAGIPFREIQIRNMYTDTIGDAIYICGISSINNDFNIDDQGIAVYTHGQWDTLGPFAGTPQDIIRWQDTLIVGGGFLRINGDSISGCAAYINGSWQPYGSFPSYSGPQDFRIINGELYALGAFDFADGHYCNGLAKRVGGQWMPVGSQSGLLQNLLSDIAEYNGHLVIAGAVGFNWTTAHGLAILNDTVWEPMGPGINGSWGQGRALAVYQGDLYVGGAIDIADGNAGHGIMRWDGSQFHPVGSGLQGLGNNYSYPTGIVEMVVRNGLLYGVGQFRFAGHVPAVGVATWDGSNWCGFGGAPGLPVDCFDFYHDTIFIGLNHYLDSVDVNYAARYTGNYPDTCTQINTSILDTVPLSVAAFQITLAGDILVAHLPIGESPCRMELLDGRGRVINTGIGTTVRFSTAGLAKGLYVLRAEGYGAQRVLLE